MFQDSGSIVGMAPSRSCTAGFILLMWLCCAPLLFAAYDPITNPDEVKALQDIKRSLVDVNGNLSNWNQGDPCTSNWTGVWCFNTTLDDGYLHVSELRLLNMNLSGALSPSLGDLSHLKILDFMWNKISGQIPMQIGDMKSLELLLLNGNQLTGSLPEELGYLPYLDRIQIDENQISGSIPNSFAFLNATQHFHMNNNSLSGQIPPELSRLPNLMHLLLDNNNLSGYLPPQLSQMPNLRVLQLDNNKFEGAIIPTSYASMTKLVKLSLRNCSLQGPIPDFSGIPELSYLDLSSNQLNQSIPSNKLSENTTTIILSDNNLSGPIPVSFSGLPRLQKLSLANNSLSGSVPSIIWQNRMLSGSERLILHFENNKLTNISGSASLPQNVTLWLQGNPACSNSSLVQFCGSPSADVNNGNDNNSTSTSTCYVQSCPEPYEYSPTSPTPCFCAAPLIIDYRLKSPGFSDFPPYEAMFKEYLTSSLSLYFYQLYIESFTWQEGPRLAMDLKFYPTYDANNSAHRFNSSEVRRIWSTFTGWQFQDNNLFGPYELLSITLSSVYEDVITISQTSGISKGALAGIILGAIAGAVMLSAIVSLLILRLHPRSSKTLSRRRQVSKASIRIDGVKDFTYAEMASATQNFNSSSQIGEGGYGRVYKGILADGTLVAIKRAQEGSLQGEREFLTEIELLSRLHHRNLVSLIGYCDDEAEQMLVYEFMSNGTVRDKLSAKAKVPLSFASRFRIALGSAKGILYLHTEANPPIFHRDIKTSNILLDSNFNAKVADFGLSRLAPVPDTEGRTPAHVSTVVRGTPGYVDPEYYLTQKLTDKSDVYSLGVVFLEILTGMQPIMHGKNIVREVKDAFQAGEIFSIIDERMGSYPSDSVEKFLDLAMKCCQQETDARPSMAEIVGVLERIWQTLPDNDPGVLDKVTNGPEKATSSGSSSSTGMRIPYLSLDVSGSNLHSGTVPAITPR